jgi:dTMP kinase
LHQKESGDCNNKKKFQRITAYFTVGRLLHNMTSDKLMRGAVIVIEGADRVGKSTRAAKLVESLCKSGERVQLLKFPDRETAIGSLISRFLQKESRLDDRAIHLLFSANRWEWFSKMKQAIESGTSLVIDRYAYSGVAYSAAKVGMDFEWCKQADRGLIKADKVLYITLPDEITRQRPGYGDEIYEQAEFQSRVKKCYDQLMDETWTVISGDVPPEQLDEVLLHHAQQIIHNVRTDPIKFLW